MRNSVKRFTAVLLLALVVPFSRDLGAQLTPAGFRYEALRQQEIRVLMSAGATADDFRVVVNRYWTFVRRYHSNGYADNALWQAANLSNEGFARFGEDRDRYRAIQLFQWLKDQYPRSRYAIGAANALEQLAVVQAASLASAAPSMAPPSPTNALETTIRAVHREVLPDLVRVTIELDHEVPFYQERLESPARLFFDLKGTKTVPSLVDATFRYETDIVRHIRLGRHPNNTTRIVLDLENVSRYSVFTLYNPYRIVIDTERSALSRAAVEPIPSAPLAPVAGRAPVPPAVPVASSAVGARAPRSVPGGTPAVPIAPVASAAPVAHSTPVAAPPPEASTATAPDTETPGTRSVSVEKLSAGGKPVMPSTNSTGKFSVARQLGLGVSRIVIDAGHGGHDPGASAFGISEAELVLDVALRLEALLQQQEGVDVVLTRRTDDFVSLEERTEIANRESADLFLSIHANASANATARGVETYFLNFALNLQAEAVAARENAASGKTMNSLSGIIKAITLNSKLNESRDFAASLQRALVRGLRPANRTVRDLGVKQAPFMVLIGASMPSALAEISFVTNPQEARLLKTPAYRQKIAEALLGGITRYQQSLKKVQTTALN